jgi:pimeloyl-ACP methyl ester carboxylesterase
VIAQLATGTARRRTLDSAGLPIAVLQSGPADGPPALLVPGYTGSKEDFGPILDPLAAAGFAVTAIDLPGQFESPGLSHRSDYTPDHLATVVLAVADLLGPSVRLLGHSFGGLVARAAVIVAPHRFTSLVLLSSGPAGISGRRRTRIEQLEPLLATAGLPAVYAAMQATVAAEPGYVVPPAELADFLERRFLGGSPVMLQGMGEALRHETDRVAELVAARVPVLVVHGADDDAWAPATQRDMATRLAAEYVVIPDAAHSAAVENPTATASALLDFWAR